jgi:hypothetical protein
VVEADRSYIIEVAAVLDILLTVLTVLAGAPDKPTRLTPEDRALAYLAREVPRWAAANNCYSCHNNGDAARALYTAARLSYRVPDESLADTSRWLARPRQWDENGGKAGFSDKGLARIQFAAALIDAVDAKQVKEQTALRQAAELVARDQQKDGSWKVDAEGAVGSPATYGPCLATYQARRILQRVDAPAYRAAITRADRWLQQVTVKNVLDAAAVLLAVEESKDEAAQAQRQQCLALVRKGEGARGGWGPYRNSPAEPFDTAVVVLALARYPDEPGVKAILRRGREFLLSAQQPDGSWVETTRPAGSESYAQRISTTGWATLALLATRPVGHDFKKGSDPLKPRGQTPF